MRDLHRLFVRAAALVALALAASCGGGGGGSGSAPPPPVVAGNFTDPTVYGFGPNASLASAQEITAVTRHAITVDGARLDYTASAGHLTSLKLGTGEPQASFFYVAYTLDGTAPATRPVTFFYNGGPGSASVWLHLGSFGPRRLATGMPATDTPTPYPLVDNAETLLDVSDLVFVDAIGSGFSQAIAPNDNRSYWGVDADGAAFRDFVMRYVAVNHREASPKFLYGESYGGPRSGVLADLLESAGVALAGVVLQSPAMNYNASCALTDAGQSCGGFLPTYGAAGAWFQRVTPPVAAAQVPDSMVTMRAFADQAFEPAFQAFRRSGVPTDPALAAQLAARTGIPAARWQPDPNFQPRSFRTGLIPGTMLGRYDARVTAPNSFPPNGEDDPSSFLISPSFSFQVVQYLANELRYTTPSTYVMLSNAIQSWNFSHRGQDLPDTIPDLASALAHNPGLKVLAVNGYHDLATPFFTTERDLARLGAPANVQVRNYLGGHMTYLDDGSRRQMKADLAQFYRSALGR